MNLKLQRETISEEEIFDFVKNNRSKLIMPDQDIINSLYSKKIKSIDENYIIMTQDITVIIKLQATASATWIT